MSNAATGTDPEPNYVRFKLYSPGPDLSLTEYN